MFSHCTRLQQNKSMKLISLLTNDSNMKQEKLSEPLSFMHVVFNHSGLKGKWIVGLFPSGFVFVWGFFFSSPSSVIIPVSFLESRVCLSQRMVEAEQHLSLHSEHPRRKWSIQNIKYFSVSKMPWLEGYQNQPLTCGSGLRHLAAQFGKHTLLLLGGDTETFCLSQSPSGIAHKHRIHFPNTNKWISPVCLILHRISS